jgi:uncharacterized protein YpuA (DUF1002 family)
MQVTLNIDGGLPGFAQTFEDLINTLSPEEKKDLAKQVLYEWLKDPHSVEMQVADQKALEFVRANLSSYDNKNQSPEELRKHYRYKDFMNSYTSDKIEMVKRITQEAIQHFEELVAKKVKEDEGLKEVYKEVEAHIALAFPGMVEQAMQSFFINSFRHQMDLSMVVQNQQYTIQDLRERLQSRGI